MESVYLDWNASAPVHPAVRDAMISALDELGGNPSGLHQAGKRARKAVEEARAQVAALVGAAEPREIIFTAGGTEANNLALAGLLRRRAGHAAALCIEHPSILACLGAVAGEDGERWTRIPVGLSGRAEVADVEAGLRPDTVLLATMLANNETGVIQPVAEVAALARRRGITVHCDAIQGAGKIPVSVQELGVDSLSISGHKLRGPKGVGALYVKDGSPLAPILHGGGQERGLRPGTENVPGIMGLGRAAEIARAELEENGTRVRSLRDQLERVIKTSIPDAVIHGEKMERLPNTSFVSFPGLNGLALLVALDRKGVAVSTGSACHAGAAGEGVLAQMGVAPDLAAAAIRISLGPTTELPEIERAAREIIEGARSLRAATGVS